MEEDSKKFIPPDFDFEAFQKEAIKKLKAGKPLSGKDGVMMPLIKRIVEAALKGEVEAHLDSVAPETRNRKNGKSSKNVRSDYGSFELDTPRDRNAAFEPELVWNVPTTINKNITEDIIKVLAYNNNNIKIGTAKSGIFSIAVMAITAPAAGEAVAQNTPYTITWTAK